MRAPKKEIFKKMPLRKASAKAQSAMEYLMTYGWAILIISVVLAALFQLGVFNPMTFAPKAPPGACQVFRPDGPGTTSFINLEGVCSGELPQYTAGFASGSSKVALSTGLNPGTGSYSVFGWVYLNGFAQKIIVSNGDEYGCSGGFSFDFPGASGQFRIEISSGGACQAVYSTSNVNLNVWAFVGFTRNSTTGTGYLYLNANPVGSGTLTNSMSPNAACPTAEIGNMCSNLFNFNGDIANIQIYNTSLSPNEIKALYLEGIGGAPIDLQHLVGWWPLNGNANDYSGNGNNGQANNVNFVSNWYSGYTPP